MHLKYIEKHLIWKFWAFNSLHVLSKSHLNKVKHPSAINVRVLMFTTSVCAPCIFKGQRIKSTFWVINVVTVLTEME